MPGIANKVSVISAPENRPGREPPMKIGGLREDILFESKEYPLALPKKDCQGGISISPLTTPLKRPKEGLRPFLWKPSWSLRGISGKRARVLRCALTGDVGTGDGGPERGACDHSELPALRETRVTVAR